MQLSDFYDYKNQLMKDLLTNDRIVELLNDPEEKRTGREMAYKQVFPYEYVPDTVEHGQTYICFDVDIQSAANKTFLYPTLYIWVFTHRSKLRLPDGGGIRTDQLCSEICKQINGSRFYGLGELLFNAAKRFAPMTDFQGKVLTFTMKEFNRLHNPTKETPVNRKTD